MAAEQRPVDLATYREAQSRSQDSRTLSTRSRIISAFERLTESEEKVSVSAMVRHAGISRATFYTHFASVDELALALLRRVIERLGSWQRLEPHRDGDASPTDHSESLETAFRLLLRYFSARRSMYAEILSGPTSGQARDELIDGIAVAVEDLGLHAAPSTDPEQLHLLALQIAGAVTTLITRWLRDELDCDEETLIASHLMILPSWMSRDEPRATPTRDGTAAVADR